MLQNHRDQCLSIARLWRIHHLVTRRSALVPDPERSQIGAQLAPYRSQSSRDTGRGRIILHSAKVWSRAFDA